MRTLQDQNAPPADPDNLKLDTLRLETRVALVKLAWLRGEDPLWTLGVLIGGAFQHAAAAAVGQDSPHVTTRITGVSSSAARDMARAVQSKRTPLTAAAQAASKGDAS